MTAEEQKQELLKQIKEQVQGELATRATKEELQSKVTEAMKPYESLDLEGLRSMTDKETGVMSILRKQGEEITNLKMANTEPKVMSVRSQIEDWAKKNKETLDRVKNGTAAEIPALHVRSAITMTNATSLNSSAYLPRVEVAPGIVDLVRVNPTFWDRLTKGRTSANPYVWVNKTNKQGNATFIGEGVTKPLASFELQTESSVPKKVAEAMKASTELLYDVDGMESFIRDELTYEVMMAANTAVLTGTASSTSPAGITTIASAYTLTTISTPNPNNTDAIVAASTQIRSMNFNQPLTAFMNPIDIANMQLQKASDSGVYMLPPMASANGLNINGIPVIEDNNIAVGYLLIGDMSKYRILMYQDFFIQFGWENDDFRKNLVTVIGEMRFHQFYSANHVGAWVYDTFANIKTAITPEIV